MGERSIRLVAAAAAILWALALPAAAEQAGSTPPCPADDPTCAPEPCADPCPEPEPEPTPEPDPCATEGNTTCQGNRGGAVGSGQVAAANAQVEGTRACKPVSFSGGEPELSWDPILGIIRVNQCLFHQVQPNTGMQLPPLKLGG